MEKDWLEEALNNWKQKSYFLEYQDSIESNGNQRFAFRKSIEECEREIQRLENLKKIQQDNSQLIDYTLLRKLLATRQWKDAEQETVALMFKAVNQDKQGIFNSPVDFPCEVLHQIDSLWKIFSEQNFGFTVQKSVWDNIIDVSQQHSYEDLVKFGISIGWYITDQLGEHQSLHWEQLNFTTNSYKEAPKGHLPSLVFWCFGRLDLGLSLIFYRLETCQSQFPQLFIIKK